MIRRIRRWRRSRAIFRSALGQIEGAGYGVSPVTWARLRQQAAMAARDELSPAITSVARRPPHPAVSRGDALARARLPARDERAAPAR
jgi:hypothetical protein